MDFVVESRLAKEAENGTMIQSLRLEEEAIREYLRLVSCDGETRPGCRKEKADAGTDAGAEDEEKCIGCDKCLHHCPMQCRKVGDKECINCGACAEVCPTKAITLGRK